VNISIKWDCRLDFFFPDNRIIHFRDSAPNEIV